MFICSYHPAKYTFTFKEKNILTDTIDVREMKTYLKLKSLPSKIDYFERILSLNYYVYFAVFSSDGFISDGMQMKNILTHPADMWKTIPENGPDCLCFFHSGRLLERETEKAKLALKKEMALTKFLNLYNIEASMPENEEREELVKNLKQEIAVLKEEIATLKTSIQSLESISKDCHANEDSRTDTLFQSLQNQGMFKGLQVRHLHQTHVFPKVPTICRLTGGCDMLFIKFGCAVLEFTQENVHETEEAMEMRDAMNMEDAIAENSDEEEECSNCLILEKKLTTGNHEGQISAEGYVMASRLIYYRIANKYVPAQNVNISSVYVGLFELGGVAEIWKYSLNFASHGIERVLKFRLAMTPENLSVAIQQLINKAKK